MRTELGGLAVLALIVLPLAACQRQEEMDEAGAPVDTAQMGEAAPAPAPAGAEGAAGGDQALGAQVYEANCATCHGASGGGDGPAGAGLQPPPANFTDGEWKYGGELESVKNVIINGIPGTAMIAWKGTLTDEEIDAVARHELAFSGGGGGE